MVEALWQGCQWQEIKWVIADKGYDNRVMGDFIKSKQATPVIPRKKIWYFLMEQLVRMLTILKFTKNVT